MLGAKLIGRYVAYSFRNSKPTSAVRVTNGMISQKRTEDKCSSFISCTTSVLRRNFLRFLDKEKKPSKKDVIPRTRDEDLSNIPSLISCETSPKGIIPPIIKYPVGLMKVQKESQKRKMV